MKSVLKGAARYVKRLAMMPWHVHNLLAGSHQREAEWARRWEESRRQAAEVSQALHLAMQALRRQESLCAAVEERGRAVEGLFGTLLKESRQHADRTAGRLEELTPAVMTSGRLEEVIRSLMDVLGQGLTDELTQLREQHADCFDQIAELLRDLRREGDARSEAA